MNAIKSAPWLYAVARVFGRAGAPLYLVGGAVRNPLMGLPISDIDVCGPARPEEAAALCEGTEVTARVRAARFGTVELHVADALGVRHMAEYTTFREDSYRCGHRPEAVRFSTELSVDALRRDFSVNALYSLVTEHGQGEVIDPTGGLLHMRDGVLHTVSDDPDRVLSEDGLRILRAARFQAELALTPTDALMGSLARHAALLGDIAPERIRDELQKTLMSDLRYPMLARREGGAESGLRTIWRTGAWRYALGELEYSESAARAVSSLGAVEGTDAEAVRMAFIGIKSGARALAACMERLRFSRREAAEAIRIADIAARLINGGADIEACAGAGRASLRAAEAVLDALSERDAAERCRNMLAALSDKPFTLGELRVSGDDLLPLVREAGLPQKATGDILRGLLRATWSGEARNERDELLRAAERRLRG